MKLTGKVEWIGIVKHPKVYIKTKTICIANDKDFLPVQLLEVGKRSNLHFADDLKEGDIVEIDFNIDRLQFGGVFYPKIVVNDIKLIKTKTNEGIKPVFGARR